MKLFKVFKKDSHSRRWMVDTKGLQHVKKYYQNYPDKNGGTKDRWSEFTVEPINKIWFDFGGMIFANEPSVEIPFSGNICEVHKYQLPELVGVLSRPTSDADKKLWSIRAWMWCYTFSTNTVKQLLAQAEKQLKLNEGIIAARENQFLNDLKQLNKDGIVVIRQGKE